MRVWYTTWCELSDRLMDELVRLLEKTAEDSHLISKADLYFEDHKHLWSREVRAAFLDLLERKKDRLHYECHRARRIGLAIGTDRPLEEIEW